jgi:flagellar assembly protein FliH
VSYEVFKLEPLDKPYTSGSGMDDPTFEAFEVVDGDQRAMFQTSTFDKRHNPIAEAKKKAASIEREAYEKGFAQGEKDGLEIGTKKIDNALDRIHQTLQEMGSYWQEFTRLNEKEILHMICLIAEKVVRGTVKVDHRVVRESIFEALNLAAERSEVTVRLSPQDVEYVKEVRPEFFDRIKELKSITIESDPSVSPGGCFMETAFGQVDARLESQLNEIAKAVERAYGERPNQPK